MGVRGLFAERSFDTGVSNRDAQQRNEIQPILNSSAQLKKKPIFRARPKFFFDMEKVMILTAEFLHKHTTAGGAWTKAQMKALGVPWPQPHHWLRGLVGKEITAEQAAAFIAGAEVFAKNQATRTPTLLFASE